jgi:hypothetical protein
MGFEPVSGREEIVFTLRTAPLLRFVKKEKGKYAWPKDDDG